MPGSGTCLSDSTSHSDPINASIVASSMGDSRQRAPASSPVRVEGMKESKWLNQNVAILYGRVSVLAPLCAYRPSVLASVKARRAHGVSTGERVKEICAMKSGGQVITGSNLGSPSYSLGTPRNGGVAAEVRVGTTSRKGAAFPHCGRQSRENRPNSSLGTSSVQWYNGGLRPREARSEWPSDSVAATKGGLAVSSENSFSTSTS
jgi:hypothetical protein